MRRDQSISTACRPAADSAEPLLVLQGDADALDVEHVAALARMAPGGRLAVVPGPSRGLAAAKPELADLILWDFFQSV